MTQGMTGFGSAESGGFKVEIRSLNHRFMDVSVKLPGPLIKHEMRLREILKARFGRGKFDVHVSVSPEGAPLKININRGALKELHAALTELKKGLSLSGDIGIGTLLEFKELFMTEELSYDAERLFEAFEEAVSGVEGMRIREGEATVREIAGMAERLQSMTEKMASAAPAAMEAGRRRFLERLKSFAAGMDEARLLQEASAAAERADISEELSRLGNHTGHMKTILAEGGLIGRKLDFLLQELNREANTIASKTDDYGLISAVVEMKAEMEKAREQAQNIE